MSQRKKLSDILGASNGGDFRNNWNNAVAADDFKPLPPGEYTFRILTGELFTSKKGTPGYKLTLEVTEGEHEGRRAWHDLWLTAAALPMAKRDLAKIGITDPEQLEQPLPPGILIRGRLVIHRDDDSNESNKLKYFEFVSVEKGDAFEPPADESDHARADDGEADQGKANDGNAVEPDPDFPFGANATTGERAPPEPSPNGKPPAGTNGTEPPAANGPPLTGASGAPPTQAKGIPAKPERAKKTTDAGTGGGINP
jgi:hypothetical protein